MCLRQIQIQLKRIIFFASCIVLLSAWRSFHLSRWQSFSFISITFNTMLDSLLFVFILMYNKKKKRSKQRTMVDNFFSCRCWHSSFSSFLKTYFTFFYFVNNVFFVIQAITRINIPFNSLNWFILIIFYVC